MMNLMAAADFTPNMVTMQEAKFCYVIFSLL